MENSVGFGAVEVNKNHATQFAKTSAFFVLALCHSGNPREGAVSPEVVQAKSGSLTEARCKLSPMRGKATVHALVFRQATARSTRKYFAPTLGLKVSADVASGTGKWTELPMCHRMARVFPIGGN